MVWCPTGDMIGEFMTKPLQGDLFCKLGYQIIGVIPDQDRGPGKYQQGKAQPVKAHPEKGKKIKSSNFFYFFLPVGQHQRSLLREVKTVMQSFSPLFH